MYICILYLKGEIEGQNIVALDEFTYPRKPGRLHSKRQVITIKQSFEYS